MVREWNTIPVRTTRNIVHWRNKIYPIRHKNSSFFGFPAAGRILPLWCLLTASPFFHKKKDRRRIHTNPSTRRLPPDTAISRKSVDSMPSSCQLEYRRNELKNFEKKARALEIEEKRDTRVIVTEQQLLHRVNHRTLITHSSSYFDNTGSSSASTLCPSPLFFHIYILSIDPWQQILTSKKPWIQPSWLEMNRKGVGSGGWHRGVGSIIQFFPFDRERERERRFFSVPDATPNIHTDLMTCHVAARCVPVNLSRRTIATAALTCKYYIDIYKCAHCI